MSNLMGLLLWIGFGAGLGVVGGRIVGYSFWLPAAGFGAIWGMAFGLGVLAIAHLLATWLRSATLRRWVVAGSLLGGGLGFWGTVVLGGYPRGHQGDLYFLAAALIGIAIAIPLGIAGSVAGWQLRRRGRLPLWAVWGMANAIAGALVGALESGGMEFLATLILTGCVVGPAQWLVLRRWFPNPLGWVGASALGWILGSLLRSQLSAVLFALTELLWSRVGAWEVLWLNVVGEPVTLLILGLAQGSVLRTAVRHAHAWIVASAIAGVVKGAMGATACLLVCQAPSHPMLAGAIANGIAWAGYGIVTGMTLSRLFNGAPTTP